MKILVTGASGQLAHAIRLGWTGAELLLPDESALDLTQRASIDQTLRTWQPDVVINAAAFTQVDLCEAKPGQAELVNGTAVGWLAQACAEAKALLVHISTDYVFDGQGKRPYRETDPTAPASVYGKTKLLGEVEAMKAPEHLILRTAWLYDAHGRNFYNTMLQAAAQGRALRVVDDQWGTPTTCRALVRQMRVAVAEGWRGRVHATCQGEATWFAFAAEIFRLHGIQANLMPCTTAEYPTPAPRPVYSVLCGDQRGRLGTDVMPPWREALAEVVAAAHP